MSELNEIQGCQDKSPEIHFLLKLLMKLEGANGVALINRDGSVFAKIINKIENQEQILNDMKLIALESQRELLELSHGVYKQQIGKLLLMDLKNQYVLVILFDIAMDGNEIFSHYYQIINFIGKTISEILINDKAKDYFR